MMIPQNQAPHSGTPNEKRYDLLQKIVLSFLGISITLMLSGGTYVFRKLDKTVETIDNINERATEIQSSNKLLVNQIGNIQEDLREYRERLDNVEAKSYTKETTDVKNDNLDNRIRRLEKLAGL